MHGMCSNGSRTGRFNAGEITEIEVLFLIAIGCDHGGFALKQEVMRHLDELGLAYKDFGTYSEESCDYPIYGEAVARAVAGGECERGTVSYTHLTLPTICSV